MGRTFVEYIETNNKNIYVCSNCKSHIASASTLIWEGFMGRGKPALLFRIAINVDTTGGSRAMSLSTGDYTLTDVACRVCNTNLGWKYLTAAVDEQKYKENTFLLERALLDSLSESNNEELSDEE